ncbi:MAG: nucleoside diphosphate kinase regulator [Xanthomonadales bacterium]|nr:nucleoside diphosphate kinase regulator [Xanthomonadales bacterium]MCC6596740.1 nucleoside diphosphate kinase regulator [Rhodanobacteraceae bacterium]MDL1867990.1 nucleoside diphosphate kinase regulator [Gammaproteobacteria bacterium PRO6]
MSQKASPPITLSSRDFDRLDALLDTPQWQHNATAHALRDELDRANVVAPEKIPDNLVTMNSTVTCVEEIGGKQHVLTLCYPAEADAAKGRVSVLAPVGAALLGLTTGQTIDWTTPDGQPLRLRVTAVTFQPEAAGQLHR